MPALEYFTNASTNTLEATWSTADATTHEIQHLDLNLHILSQEEIKAKEIQHKKDCKLRNKLKRKDIFVKKGLY